MIDLSQSTKKNHLFWATKQQITPTDSEAGLQRGGEKAVITQRGKIVLIFLPLSLVKLLIRKSLFLYDINPFCFQIHNVGVSTNLNVACFILNSILYLLQEALWA